MIFVFLHSLFCFLFFPFPTNMYHFYKINKVKLVHIL
jgi:hypothetical protein